MVIPEIKDDIFKEINIINQHLSINSRSEFFLPILKDLYSACICYENFSQFKYSHLSAICELERKTNYESALAWYRKIMEHLYIIIILDADIDINKYNTYKLYREYDILKRKIRNYKECYDIKEDENIEYLRFKEIEEILSKLSSRGELYTSSKNFQKLDIMHMLAFTKGSACERLLMGGRSYERMYGLLSYSIHTNPYNLHRINYKSPHELENFMTQQFLSLIKAVLKRHNSNTKYKICSEDELLYAEMFIGTIDKGTVIDENTITNISRYNSKNEDIGENILTVYNNGKQYRLPFIDLKE